MVFPKVNNRQWIFPGNGISRQWNFPDNGIPSIAPQWDFQELTIDNGIPRIWNGMVLLHNNRQDVT